MQFSDTTTKTGVLQAIERFTDLGDGYITGDTDQLHYFTNLVNDTNKDIINTIFEVTGEWVFDDENYANLPEGTTNLVNGTADYKFPVQAMSVRQVAIYDEAGNEIYLRDADDNDFYAPLEELYKEAGKPQFYKLVANVLTLYPTPNYDYTDGLKVFFERASVDFAYTDTTKTPGFNVNFHELLPLGASVKFLRIKQPGSATLPNLVADYTAKISQLKHFYSTRYKSAPKVIGRRYESWK